MLTKDDMRKALDAEDAEAPVYTQPEIMAKINESGGRIHRGREVVVFCLIQNRDILRWLLLLGAKFHAGIREGYRRTDDGPTEWDLYLHLIPTSDAEEHTWWESSEPYLARRR